MRAFLGNDFYFKLVQIFKEADTDGDGLISKSEFRQLLISHNLLTWVLHDSDEILIHVINFKKLSMHQIYKISGGYTRVHFSGD